MSETLQKADLEAKPQNDSKPAGPVEVQPGFKWTPFADLKCDFPGCQNIAY